jgi:hypothetical protein
VIDLFSSIKIVEKKKKQIMVQVGFEPSLPPEWNFFFVQDADHWAKIVLGF